MGMKLVLKDRKTIKENTATDARLEWKVKTDPENFLALAKEDKTGNVQARAAAYGKFDPEKASGMYLAIDPTTGQVTEHGGRGRSQTALNSGVTEVEISIKVDTSKGDGEFTWDKLPKYFLPEDGRQGYVAKSEFKLIEVSKEANFEDILRLGGKPKTFERVVIQNKNGPYVREDPSRNVPVFVSVKYSEQFTSALRKSAGMKDIPGNLPVDVATAITQYIELVNKQYSFSDEQGEMKIMRAFPNGSSLKLDRQSESNVTITPR
jgi:hypothetical protein